MNPPRKPIFNTISQAVVDDIFVEFVLADGRVITIMAETAASAEVLATFPVMGIEVEFG